MMPSVVLPFIVLTDKRDVDADTRKLIRSHVMRGKNKGKAPKKGPKGLLPASDKADALCSSMIGRLKTNYGGSESSIPRPIGSAIGSVQFADTVEPSLVADILLCKYHPLDMPQQRRGKRR